MAERKRMIIGLLAKADYLLLKVEILAILLLVIIPHFTRESIIDFTRSSFLSLGISSSRRLIWTTLALPPDYTWVFWLERTVTFSMLIFYHRLAISWGIAFCFYLLSTICSSSIVYFMPTRKWQGLPKNPSPEANKGEVLVQKIDILQRLMFWMERLVVLVCIFLVSRYARFSTVFFCFSDFIYLVCFALSLEVDPLPPGPDYLFLIERIAIIILELKCTDQTPYNLFIARGLFFLTNSCYSVHSYTPTFKGLISKAYNPKVREAENGLQSKKKEAKMEDEPQKEKFKVYEGEDNNWENELVAKYWFTDHISEFTCTQNEEESPELKFEVHRHDGVDSWEKDTIKAENEEEAPNKERYNWEEPLVSRYGLMEPVSDYKCTKFKEAKNSEIEEESPKGEDYKSTREDDLGRKEAPRGENRKSLNASNARCDKWQWSDYMSSDRSSHSDYFFQPQIKGADENWGEELVMADQVDTVSSNDSSDLMEDNMKTAENESNKEAFLEDTGEVERLRAETENLKREKEAMEREKEALTRKKEALEDHNQKLDAMLVEAKMKSQVLVEELESHFEFEEQMLETLKICKQDCRKWEQESKDIGTKLEEVIAAIGKEQQTVLNGQKHVCKCKEESKKWESEKIVLNKQLEEANSWYVYYFNAATEANSWIQYYMQRENVYESWMSYYKNNIYSLVKSNTDLATRLEVQTSKSTRYHNRAYEYKERCRALEEDKNILTAKLSAADASSELYRSMLHDLDFSIFLPDATLFSNAEMLSTF